MLEVHSELNIEMVKHKKSYPTFLYKDRLPVVRIGRNTNKNPKFFCMIILQLEKNKLIRNKSFFNK